MTDKLDRYAPSAEILSAVKNELVKAGVSPEVIPEDWVGATIAALSRWMQQRPEGLNYAARLLGFQIVKGGSDREYEVLDRNTGESYPIDSDKIFYYCGVVANKIPVNPEDVLSVDKPKDDCEFCQTRQHCVKETRDGYQVHKACGYCTRHAFGTIQHQGDNICHECTVTQCPHHPSKPGK